MTLLKRNARRKWTGLATAIFAALLPVVPAAALDARDRTIVPGKRVGAITATATRATLVRIYGATRVKPAKIHIGEGEMARGLTVLPGTADELQIQFAQKGSLIEFVRIKGATAAWRTAEGIGIGVTAANLEKLNGRPFSLTGFGWDYPGRIINWRRGRLGHLTGVLIPAMSATQKVPANEERKILGEGPFSSAHPVIRKKRLVVGSLLIRLKP